jgi:hypothetical protein
MPGHQKIHFWLLCLSWGKLGIFIIEMATDCVTLKCRGKTQSHSSAEAKYRGVANAMAESCWLRQMLQELGHTLQRSTIVFCDNVSATCMSQNYIHHQWTKHIKIDLHFVRDKVSLGEVKVLYVPASRQFADIFTKGLPSTIYEEFHSSLNTHPRPE